MQHLELRSNLSYADFFQNYSLALRPVVITDYSARVLRTPWTWSHVNRVCAETRWPLKTRTGASSGFSASLSEPLEDLVTLDAFTAAMRATPGHEQIATFYIHDASIANACPDLLIELAVPKYFSGDWFQNLPPVIHAVDAKEHERGFSGLSDHGPSLFVGPSSSSSPLKVDSYGSQFWMLHLEGRKRWILFDPIDRDLVMTNNSDLLRRLHFDTSAVCPDFEALGLRKPAWVGVLEPGDLIFVPAGTPHQVLNVDDTLALSMNYIDGSNVDQAIELFAASDSFTGPSMSTMLKQLRSESKRDGSSRGPQRRRKEAEPCDLSFIDEFKSNYWNRNLRQRQGAWTWESVAGWRPREQCERSEQ